MMKRALLLVGLLSIAACTTPAMKEARCKCFGTDGSPTGSCNFTRLPGDAAVFSFMASGSDDPVSRMSLLALTDELKNPELCGE